MLRPNKSKLVCFSTCHLLEHIPFYSTIIVRSHNVNQSGVRAIDPFSINSDDVSFDASTSSDSPPTSHPTPIVTQ